MKTKIIDISHPSAMYKDGKLEAWIDANTMVRTIAKLRTLFKESKH